MRIDLHMHSTFSDGLNTPTELVEMAVKKDVGVMAVTDHDSLGGVAEALEAGSAKGIEVVSGVELSSEFKGRDLHILGYGMDPHDAEFLGMLTQFRETRHKRGIKIIEKLNALGMAIDPADVLEKSGKGALGRPHIAAVMVEKGFVSGPSEAFDKYIADGGPAYVAKYKMTPEEAIRHIRGAGGLAFIAHPGIFLEDADELMELVSEGFDGVEVYHPTHSASRMKELKSIAEEQNMLVSGGSDFHGFAGRDKNIGALDIPYEVWEKIKQRLAER